MTRIEFNFNVPDKRQLIENLALAALQKHRKVTIFTENAAQSASISEYLWQNNPTSFLPNIVTDLVADSTRALTHASASRMVIGSQADTFDSDLIYDDLLINLTATEPGFFSRFTQLVELVGVDEQDKLTARARYKFYRDRGYEINSIDYAKL
jgi:DNA polymerase III subunit chi